MIREHHTLRNICVYCASSTKADKIYMDSAYDMGKIFAFNNIQIIYGGGAIGLMGRLADGAIEEGGAVTGIIPKFMAELEWGHKAITKMVIVDSMHERKQKMIENVDAVVALPGGCGTLEELLETLTLKRLGLFFMPVVLVNINDFFDPLIKMFDRCIEDRFMDIRHRDMWTISKNTAGVISAIKQSAIWHPNAREFAVL